MPKGSVVMIKGYKIIGMCATKINDESCTEFIEQLSIEAIANGYRLFVFNSFRDFYYDDEYDAGAKSIYKLINFEVIDALIVDFRSFFDFGECDALIQKAKQKDIPVITIGGTREALLFNRQRLLRTL